MDTNFKSVISRSARGHYRQHPLEFKRALVALSLQPGASVARIARDHGVNANQVFSWRKLYSEGRLGEHALMRDDGLLQVVLTLTAPVPGSAADASNSNIVLEVGQVRLHINGRADPTLLAQVLERGRPPLNGDTPMSERVEVRMTPTQLYAFDRKGGAVWLRSTLDRDIANMP